METEAQLSWEVRFGRIAAAGALAAVAFQVASFAVQLPVIKDAPGRDEALRYRKTLLNFHDNAGALLGSAITQGLAAFCAAAALFYLFRATRHRREELPAAVRWLLLVAPVLISIAVIVNWTGLNNAADRYTGPRGTSDVRVTPSSDQRKDATDFCTSSLHRPRRSDAVRACAATRARQEAVAKKLVQDEQSALGPAALFGGTIALAFSYVIIALNAMRAGLLSRFMGILGVIVGALIVLPLLPQGVPVVQVFWLGGLGLLFLGIWPGGRGPAWETGEAIPWPTPQRRARLPGPGEADEPAPPEPAEGADEVEEPARPHPVSKKRKRKRRR